MVGTFWGVLNVSLRASGTQLGLTYFFVLSLYIFVLFLDYIVLFPYFVALFTYFCLLFCTFDVLFQYFSRILCKIKNIFLNNQKFKKNFCWHVQFIENISLLQCCYGCCAVAMRLLYGCYAFACFVLHVFRTFSLFSPILCKLFFKKIKSTNFFACTCNS